MPALAKTSSTEASERRTRPRTLSSGSRSTRSTMATSRTHEIASASVASGPITVGAVPSANERISIGVPAFMAG